MRSAAEGSIQEVYFAETYLGHLDPQVSAFFAAKLPAAGGGLTPNGGGDRLAALKTIADFVP